MTSLLLALIAPAVLAVAKGEASLVPPEPLPLGGYTRRGGKVFEPGGDALKARSLIFSSNQTLGRVALVSVELLTVPESLYEAVKAKLKQPMTLMIVATHTHCAPDSQMLNARMNFAIPGIATHKERWLDWFSTQIADSVNGAKPWRTFTEIRVQEKRLDANRGRRAGATPDTTFTQVQGVTAKGEIQDLFFSFAAHATVYDDAELKLRRDWPGLLDRRGLFLPGAIGDVSPKADGPDATTKLEDMRKRLTARVPFWESQVWAGRQTSFAASFTAISLPKATPHPEFAKENGIPDPLATTLVNKFAPPAGRITGFRLGKLAIVGVPGEPSSQLGRQMRNYGRGLGFTSVLVISHVNGWIGYLLDPADYDRGGYEATLNFYGKTGGDAVLAATKENLQTLTQNARRQTNQ